MDNDHSVFVWDVETGKMLGTDKFGPDPVFDVASSKNEDNYFGLVGKRGVQFLTAGGM